MLSYVEHAMVGDDALGDTDSRYRQRIAPALREQPSVPG